MFRRLVWFSLSKSSQILTPSVRIDHRGLPVFLTLFTHGSPPDADESECSFSTIMKTFCAPLPAGRFSLFQCSVFPFFLLGFVLPLWNLAFLFPDPFLESICSGDRELLHSVCAGEANTVESKRTAFPPRGRGEREARRGGRCPRAAGPQVCVKEPELTESQVPLKCF